MGQRSPGRVRLLVLTLLLVFLVLAFMSDTFTSLPGFNSEFCWLKNLFRVTTEVAVQTRCPQVQPSQISWRNLIEPLAPVFPKFESRNPRLPKFLAGFGMYGQSTAPRTARLWLSGRQKCLPVFRVQRVPPRITCIEIRVRFDIRIQARICGHRDYGTVSVNNHGLKIRIDEVDDES
jgi:hypothetical protein